jgi:ABC-type nitrate/sulfonate/bicarbonate transport system permease component
MRRQQLSVVARNPSARPRRIAHRRSLPRTARVAYGFAGIVALILAWEGMARAGWINPLVGSSPWQIAISTKSLYDRGVLIPALQSTGELFLIGFGISLAIGLVGGMILGWYTRVNAIFDPWVSLFYATPRIALIPLIIVWVGVDLKARVIVVILIAAFPILINVASGIATIDRDHLRLARSFLATNWDVLRTVALPGAIPSIVTGIRQGLVQGLIGVVVAEYFLGNTGVGGLIFQAGLTLRTAEAFVGALVFAIAALILTAALQVLERRLDRWRATS